VNVTGDTHPMHTHLVTFQVVGRTPFDAAAYEEAPIQPDPPAQEAIER
jgi:FtsP/CotA-like multicopper oxidase with cupredoxin domain